MRDSGFEDIVISLKSSSVKDTIDAYRLFSLNSDVPLHIGVTEAGTALTGAIKSAIGIGCLLAEGIGDTLRVSLTAPPEREVEAGIHILKALGLRSGIDVISCPTCGRCKVDLIKIASDVEIAVSRIKKPLKIAVMGCAVNGPGEAREADAGVACGIGEGLIFVKGEVVKKVEEANITSELIRVIEGL